MEKSSAASFENTHDEQTEYIAMLADEDMVIDSNLMDEKHSDKKDANSRSFPNILMDILSNDDCSECIHWCPDGKAFEISNPEKLATITLPIYFKNSKYTSFIRKLYRWGFQMNDLQHKSSFYNKNFLRDNKDLLSRMRLKYSPKELRLKRTNKDISKKFVIRMLKTDNNSSVRMLQSGTSFNNVQPQPQALNTQSNLQIPQVPLINTYDTSNVSLQQPPQEQFLHASIISSGYLLSNSSFNPNLMSDNHNNNSQSQPQSSGLIASSSEIYHPKKLQSGKYEAKESHVTADLSRAQQAYLHARNSNCTQAQQKSLDIILSPSKIDEPKKLQSDECGFKESTTTPSLSGFHKMSSHLSNKKCLYGDCTGKKKVKDSYVQHDYHDYSLVLYKDVPSNYLSNYHMNHKGGNDILFPQKLHSLLSHAEISDKDIISWAPHGRCFSIKNRKKFVEKCLVPMLDIKMFPSFQRQLNRYNFKSITRFGSKDRGSYYHELFLRGRPSLCEHIRGIRNKGNGFKPLSNPQDEPDFSSFPHCYDINQELELINTVASRNDPVTLSNSFINMGNDLPTQEVFYRSANINTLFPPTSIGMSMDQCMVQQAIVEKFLSFIVDRKTTMPIQQDRFQFTGVPNASFPLMSNHNHSYITNHIEPSSLFRPFPSSSRYSSHAPLVERSLAAEQIMFLSRSSHQG